MINTNKGMQVWTNLKTTGDCFNFASLPFKGQRREWIQAYYSNLFDLWESGVPDPYGATDDYVARARWNVEEYARSKRWELDRDSSWLVVFSGDQIWSPDKDGDGMLIQ
jgi:hypothetical protein